MRQHTIIFDMDVQNEDIVIIEQCTGVTGVAAYRNVVNVYYTHPIGEREKRSLSQAMCESGLLGTFNDDAPAL